MLVLLPEDVDGRSAITAIIGGTSYDPIAFDSLFYDNGGLNALSTGSVGAGDGFIQFRMTAPTNGGWSFDFEPTVDEDGNPAFVFREAEFSASAPITNS